VADLAAQRVRLRDGLTGYVLLARMWMRVSMAYRTSFVVMTLGQFFITGLDFAAILVMFSHIDRLGGFDLGEIAFLYGGSGIALGTADLLIGNIERLGQKIRLGQLDAMLVRPVSLYAQVCADDFALRRFGRILQAAVVLGWGAVAAGIDWDLSRVLVTILMLVAGTAIFLALFTLGASLQFWTSDGSEAANAFTYGGNTVTQYPLTIYPAEAVKALTFLVPVAFVNWYPSLYVLHRPDPLGLPSWLQLASPLAALVLGLLAAAVWRVGVRRYQSTGS